MAKAKANRKAGASATRTGKGTAKPAVPVLVEVDRALKQRWTALSETVAAAKREGASAFDRLWEAVAAIVEHEPPLYLAGGFATARAFYAATLGETERSARRNMRIALYASPVEEARYGPSKLDAAIHYVEAKAGAPAKGRVPVDFGKLRIPVEEDGRARSLPLDEVTVEQIEAATRALRRKAGRPAKKASPVVKAIEAGLGRSGPLAKVRVSYAGGTLTLSGIPPEALAALAKALARVELPAPDDDA